MKPHRPRRRFSFFQVVLFFAAISLGAAILIFIAANWELIPRLFRVIGVAVVMLAAFVGGALVNGRAGLRARLVEEALYLVAGAAYMGGVALVGQMYHISGDVRAAALTYAIGLGLSGFAVRSQVLVALAAAWITYWQVNGPDAGNLLSLQFLIFAASIACGIGFAFFIRSRWLRRGLYVAGLIGLLPFVVEVLEFIVDVYEAIPHTIRVAVWVILWACALGVLIAERWRPGLLHTFRVFQRDRVVTAFMSGLVANGFLHGELGDDAGLVVAGTMAMAYVLITLYAHGRDHRAIRYTCYTLFGGEVLLIYGETVFSMLGTSGFFLVVAVVLTAIAWVVYRLEKRITSRKKVEDAEA